MLNVNFNTKDLEVKKNHHYVWADYMKRWSKNNRDVFHTTKKNKIIKSSVKGISVEKDFYAVQEFTGDDRRVLNNYLKTQNEIIRESGVRLLQDIENIELFDKINKEELGSNEAIDLALNALRNNYIENYHADREVSVKVMLEKIDEDRDLLILDDLNNKQKLALYLGLQFSRTRRTKDAFEQAYKSEGMKAIAKHFWFTGYLFGLHLGLDLCRTMEQDNYSLLVNNSNIPFITSDSPVINLADTVNDPGDFYYPLSPSLALVISSSEGFDSGVKEIDAILADKLNIKIAEESNIYIINEDEISVKKYQCYV